MASPREALVNEHRSSLMGLETVFSNKVEKNYLPTLLGLNGVAQERFAYEGYRQFVQPFMLTSMQIGSQFYNFRRTQAEQQTGKTYSSFTALVGDTSFEQIIAGVLDTKSQFIGGKLLEAVGLGQSPQMIMTSMKDILKQPVAQPDRDIIQFFTDEDDEATGLVRMCRSSGCEFCKGASFSWGNDESYGMESEKLAFHDGCNCVLDASFSSEKKLRQSFEPEYEKKVAEARSLIQNGEAGTRVIHRDSPEWRQRANGQIDRATGETIRSEEVANGVDGSRSKASKATSSEIKKQMREDKDVLKSWLDSDDWKNGKVSPRVEEALLTLNIPADDLLKPRTIPITALTDKNMKTVLRRLNP